MQLQMFADIFASVYKLAFTLKHYPLIRNLKAINVNILDLLNFRVNGTGAVTQRVNKS